jgi:hypothetical protein
MSPKYSVDQDDASQWQSDTEYELRRWSSKPFVGHRHRHETVEQRILLEYTHGVGIDILYQARSDDTEKFPGDWRTVESIEVREYGARHEKHESVGYLR